MQRISGAISAIRDYFNHTANAASAAGSASASPAADSGVVAVPPSAEGSSLIKFSTDLARGTKKATAALDMLRRGGAEPIREISDSDHDSVLTILPLAAAVASPSLDRSTAAQLTRMAANVGRVGSVSAPAVAGRLDETKAIAVDPELAEKKMERPAPAKVPADNRWCVFSCRANSSVADAVRDMEESHNADYTSYQAGR